VTLAVATGIPHRIWLADPAAMGTAIEVLERINQAKRR
jgi:hypothetical protein